MKAVAVTTNEKLGAVAATYASQASCPRSCPFYKSGCYAEHGPIYMFVTKHLNESGERNTRKIARLEADAIDGLPATRDLRVHVVGDSRTDASARIVSAACERYVARGIVKEHGTARKPVAFTYTHAWETVDRASWGRVSVLASCESTRDARRAMRRGYAAAIVVDRFRTAGRAYKEDGVTVLPCPNQTRGVQCVKCRLCWNDKRLRKNRIVIAFSPHGSGKGYVRETVRRVALPVLGG